MRIFKEEQRFNQTWIIVLLLISTLIPILVLWDTYVNSPNSLSTTELVAILAILLLSPSILFFFKLSTRIDEKGIHYKFFPFHLNYKLIEWHTIKQAYVRNYDAITEYGGWGLKGGIFWKKSNGKAINVSGDIGIQLILKNGKKLLIGTQKQDDVKRLIEAYKTKTDTNV